MFINESVIAANKFFINRLMLYNVIILAGIIITGLGTVGVAFMIVKAIEKIKINFENIETRLINLELNKNKD